MAKGAKVYYCMMRGLRGCYMPDDVAHYEAASFPEFCRTVRDAMEFADMVSAGQTRFAWEYLKSGRPLEVCVAIARKGEGGSSYGLMVSAASEADYRADNELEGEGEEGEHLEA